MINYDILSAINSATSGFEALKNTLGTYIPGGYLNNPALWNDSIANTLQPNDVCCDNGTYKSTIKQDGNGLTLDVKKEENKMMNNMMQNATEGLFNGIFGRIAPDMCRISMSGNIAIRTPNGYKSYNVKTGRLTNCSNFAFNIGEDAFFVIPTNKVEKGDIILVNGKPHCVISSDKNRIEGFCYEDSSVHTIVPEHHVFMGKSYLYGKIISMFGDIGKGNGMNKMMKFMMLSQMMNGGKNGNAVEGMSQMLPMMMLMGGGGVGSIFDGMFDFEDDGEEESKEEEEA